MKRLRALNMTNGDYLRLMPMAVFLLMIEGCLLIYGLVVHQNWPHRFNCQPCRASSVI